MMSIANLCTRQPIPNFTAYFGDRGIRTLLTVMWDAYKDLCSEGTVGTVMNEDEITEEWFCKVYIHFKHLDLPVVPVYQKADSTKAKNRGKKPTIDFCFRSEWDCNSYFGAECKIVDGGKPSLYAKYINKGVNRYLEGIYGSKSASGAMVGYIRKGDVNMVVSEIKTRLHVLPGNPSLFRDKNYKDDHYTSTHKRDLGVSPFNLHHLFFVFC